MFLSRPIAPIHSSVFDFLNTNSARGTYRTFLASGEHVHVIINNHSSYTVLFQLLAVTSAKVALMRQMHIS